MRLHGLQNPKKSNLGEMVKYAELFLEIYRNYLYLF